jgi:hypothetical protein
MHDRHSSIQTNATPLKRVPSSTTRYHFEDLSQFVFAPQTNEARQEAEEFQESVSILQQREKGIKKGTKVANTHRNVHIDKNEQMLLGTTTKSN